MPKLLHPRPKPHVYLLKMPYGLWRACQAKARAHHPPLTMRWIIVDLLRKYLRTSTAGGALSAGRFKHGEKVSIDPEPVQARPKRPLKEPKPITRRVGAYPAIGPKHKRNRRTLKATMKAPDISSVF